MKRSTSAMRTASALAMRQVEGMRRVRDGGPTAWCAGFEPAGGAVARMFKRMADAGLVTRVPYNITPFGRRVLASFDASHKRGIA